MDDWTQLLTSAFTHFGSDSDLLPLQWKISSICLDCNAWTRYIFNLWSITKFNLLLLVTLTDLLIHTEHAKENDDRNNEVTINSDIQQPEEMSGSSSDIFYNYENDSDEYYSLEDFDVSTNDI